MQFIDHNTDRSRIDPEIRPLLLGLLENTQIYREDADPRQLTGAIKYRSTKQDRRDPSPYTGTDKFIQAIDEFFEFNPLDFQVKSWELIDKLDAKRQSQSYPQAGIFAAPTGFGKTEAFLGALYQLLIEGRQNSAAVVYPRTALLSDQLGRILKHFHKMDADLSVGIYMGDQPWGLDEVEDEREVFEPTAGGSRFKLTNCWCGDGEEYSFYFEGGPEAYDIVCENNPDHSFSHDELILSRKEMAHNGKQPDILLTTLESLEGFSLKPNYNIINRIDTVVLDEVHMYTGLRGAHAAHIFQNINAVTDSNLLWLGASATIDNPDRFVNKLFDYPSGNLHTVEPPDSDYKENHNDQEHYYFMITPEDGPTVSALMLQQTMLVGHTLLGGTPDERTKALSFIDSRSQVNQKLDQIEDAEITKQLWQEHLHGDGYENWRNVAEGMNQELWMNDLNFMRAHSNVGFDARDASDADTILTTSYLEVGIDVGDIEVVTQYRTPQALSSFIQRSGRAAREPDMDSHILIFLSNLTSDANMFYRADRFLESELRTPLKPDNNVVDWIHSQLITYYEIVTGINSRQYQSNRDEEQAFFEVFLSSHLSFDRFYQFLVDPSSLTADELNIDSVTNSLQAEEPIENLSEALERRLEQTRAQFSDIEEHISINGAQVGRSENAPEVYVSKVEDSVLEFLADCTDEIAALESALNEAGSEPRIDLSEIRSSLTDLRDGVNNIDTTLESRIRACQEGLTDAGMIVGQIRQLRTQATQETDATYDGVDYNQLGELEDLVLQLEALEDEDELKAYFDMQKEIHYLKDTLDQLSDYYGLDRDPKYRPSRPFESLYQVKNLLRAAYYFDRYLSVRGDGLDQEIWYVPPNYFEASGRYMSITYPNQNTSQESIDSLVHSYAPLVSEYQGSGTLQAFVPDTVYSTEKDEVRFDFSEVDGEQQGGVLVPDTLALSNISDLSDDAKDIVRYCPVCYDLLNRVNCSSHNESSTGKVHADPQISTETDDATVVDEYDRTRLVDLTGEVSLEGVTLSITPARYDNSQDEYIFTGGDHEEAEITSPEPPLGFRLDTRGLVFDISDYLDIVLTDRAGDTTAPDKGSIEERVRRYKDFSVADMEDLAYHTAAHFFLQLVADVSGVNTNMLFYGTDRGDEEVYVFERTEGGQGLTDLVFNEIEVDPGNVLASILRIAYNTQVINERLWANEAFVDEITDTDVTTETVEQLVSVYLRDEVPYPQIHEQVAQEVILTADRASQLASEEDIEVDKAYQIKQRIAEHQIQGEDEFPTTKIEDEFALSDSNRAKSRFFSPDIDGCVENLHVSECISGHNQQDTLSYVLLDELREQILTTADQDSMLKTALDSEMLPGGVINDQSIFLGL